MKVRLQTFLALLLLMVSSLPVLVFLLWPFSSVYDARLSEVRERHLLLARNIGGAMELYQEDLVTAMQAFSGSIARSDADDARSLFSHLNFYHVCVIEKATGVVKSSYLGAVHPCPKSLPSDLIDHLVDLSEDGVPGFGGVVKPGDGTPRIRIVSDLGDLLVVGAVGTEFFREQQSAISFGENGHAAIVDQFGRVLAHPNADWEEEAKDLSALEIVQAMMRGETDVVQFFSPAFNEDMIAGYTAVPGVGWGVMVPQPLREFQVAAQEFNREVLLILLTGLAASLFAAFFLARVFEKRLDGIEHMISDISQGAEGISLGTKRRTFNISTFHRLEQSIIKMFSELKLSREAQLDYSLKLEQTNEQLKSEIDTRKTVQTGLSTVEKQYSSLFENVPVAIREQDLSAFKAKVDALGLNDVEALEQYLDENPSFLIECGKTVRILDANAASVKLHGYEDKSEMMAHVLDSFGPESIAFIRRFALAIFNGKTRDRIQTAIYQSSGHRRTLITSWSVLPGHELDFARCLVTSVDISEQVEAEEALRQSQKMEAIGQLTGGIAHDFNNLLAVLQGNAELLALNPAHDRDLIEPIKSAVHRGAELTQRLLAFSRKQALMPKSVDLLALANSMGSLLRRTLGPNIKINIHGRAGLYNVHADPGQIEAALLNLALNARDAMPNGGTLDILCRPALTEELSDRGLEKGEYAVLSVRDNGEGIAAGDMPHIFEPFFTTKPVGKGSGLGLSMVYGFSRQSNGDVFVESEVGKGTTVRIFLPRARKTEQERTALPALEGTQGNVELSVLVLEDNPEVLQFMKKALLVQGYQVSAAISTDEARSIMDKGIAIDLLISDVLLPGNQNGPDFAVEFREQYPNCPIIFVSGYPANLQDADGDRLKNTLWLAKPFQKSELSAAIEQLVFGG